MRGALIRDGWLPVLLVGLALAEVRVSYTDHPAGATALLSVLVPMALLTAGRRRAPVIVAVAETILVGILMLAVLPSPTETPPLTPFLCVLAALFNLGLHGRGPTYAAGAVGVGTGLAALEVGGLVAGRPWGDVVPSLIFFTGAFVVGRLLHHTRSQALSARARAEEAELTREAHARLAAEEERARIARELHDVLAHVLTEIVVQASVEARVQPADAPAVSTLRAIERQGREAMVELRRLLGLLRHEGQGPADAPLPSLARAEALADDLRRAGHDVELQRDGALDDLPPGVDLAAYRVLQESLTNVARHAPGAPVRIRLSRDDREVAVRVDSGPGSGPSPQLSGGGHGLPGMHERVRLYDGQLEAAPRPDGGFTVEARLPTAAPGVSPAPSKEPA